MGRRAKGRGCCRNWEGGFEHRGGEETSKRFTLRGNLTSQNLPDSLSICSALLSPIQIREVINTQGIRVYSPPIETDDEASAEHAKTLMSAMPFSIIGSTLDVQTPDGRTVKGRDYLWGVAEGKFSIPEGVYPEGSISDFWFVPSSFLISSRK